MLETHSSNPAEGKRPIAPLDFRIANSIDLWDQAFKLIYERYLHKGLISENPFQRRVTEYHLRPQTNVFVACRRGKVVATASLVNDTPEGMPIDQLYNWELEEFRQAGISMAEVTSLACEPMSFHDSNAAFMGMMRLLGQHAQRFRIDQLVAAVHPKHAKFYVRTMGFQYFGDERTYESMHDAPAVGCFLNFEYVELNRPPYYDFMLGEKISLIELLPQPLAPHAFQRFQVMVTSSEELIPLGT